jgi:urease accessory protein UreF
MAAVGTIPVAFSLVPLSNAPLEQRILHLMWTNIINIAENCVRSTVH